MKASPDGHIAMAADSSSSSSTIKRNRKKGEPRASRRKSTLPSLFLIKITWQDFASEHLLQGDERFGTIFFLI